MSEPDQLRHLPPVFTYADARNVGISDRHLNALRERQVIDRIARGLYRRADLLADSDLLELIQRAPNAALCLGTALARHGLSDEIPAVIDAAIPRNQRPPVVAAPIQWHRFDPETFAIGREQAIVSGVSVGIYSPERSICDAYRLRHLGGYEEASEALKRWLRRPTSKPSHLLRMARNFGPRAERPIQEALQLLL